MPENDARSLHEAAPGRPELRFYETGHAPGDAATGDRTRWLTRQLRLRTAP